MMMGGNLRDEVVSLVVPRLYLVVHTPRISKSASLVCARQLKASRIKIWPSIQPPFTRKKITMNYTVQFGAVHDDGSIQ